MLERRDRQRWNNGFLQVVEGRRCCGNGRRPEAAPADEGRKHLNGFPRAAILLPAWLLCTVLPVSAQLHIGEVSAKGNGTVSSGYSATYGNQAISTHSWQAGGAATVSGAFHNPNFLSYDASFYLNQSRANSNFQSISSASGVNLSSNIFAGSPFPGALNYSKAYNSEGNYAIPGLTNYVTHGNSDTFGINWNENLPDKPSLSAGWQVGKSQYTVYGTNDEGNNSFHSINLNAGYKLDGFTTGAFYTTGGAQSRIPQIIAGLQSTQIDSANNAWGVNATHLLPYHGSFSSTFNRSYWDSSYLGTSTSGTIDMVTAQAAVQPRNDLSFSVSSDYSDNLSGQLVQAVVTAGGFVPGYNTNATSNSLDIMSIASYTPVPNTQASVYFERRTQSFLGSSYGVDSYGASATYAHALLGGTINGAGSVTANRSDTMGGDSLSFSLNENYSTSLLGWNVTESFGYAQNAETLLITYMNSYYNYSANVRRRWGPFNVSAGAGGARTALTDQPGTTSTSETYEAAAGYGQWITATGSYSKSSGQAIATGAGLVPVPVPSPVLPSSVISLYGGDSYSFGVSSTPARKLIMAVTYAKSTSDTTLNSIASANQNNEFSTLIQYQYRKLDFMSGYARLEQGFSNSGLPPEVIASYYVGVSRWFNFF